MTELSPAAQAVLDAVASQMEGGWVSPEFIPYEARKIAAALRAAVEQCTYRDVWEDRFLSAERILTIADELESND